MTQDLNSKIRLSNEELRYIQSAFKEFFLPNDHLWIFGSRADLNKKGGDIDLYIETNIKDFADARAKQDKLIYRLWDQIGEQRIDIIVKILSDEKELTIHKIAKDTGVQIV